MSAKGRRALERMKRQSEKKARRDVDDKKNEKPGTSAGGPSATEVRRQFGKMMAQSMGLPPAFEAKFIAQMGDGEGVKGPPMIARPSSNDRVAVTAARYIGPKAAAEAVIQLEDRNQQQVNVISSLTKEKAELEEFVQSLGEAANLVGLVSGVSKAGRLTVRVGAMTFESKMPLEVDGTPTPDAKDLPLGISATPAKIGVGDFVAVVQPQNQVLKRIEAPRVGATGSVTHIDEAAGTFEVSVNGISRSVVRADACKAAKVGDAVVVDETGYFALTMAVQPMASHAFEEETGVSWDEIGGLEDAKEALREAIEYPIRFASLYAGYARKPAKGALLWGPPGCGKTMLGKAVATSLRAAHARDGKAIAGGFLYIKGPELLNKYVGATEDKIRQLFERARRYRADSGHPAVVFIDEAEALLGARGGRSLSGLEATTVPTFLAEMDGLDTHAAFVLLSTNRPDSLDPAVVRDGRIDRRIEVKRPRLAQALEILHLATADTFSDERTDLQQVAEAMFSDLAIVSEICRHEGHHLQLRMRDVMSGAVIAGVVGRAIEHAIRRDREAGLSEPSGLTHTDFDAAIRASCAELGATPHMHEVFEIVQAHLGAEQAKEWRESNRPGAPAGGLN
jgi:proteasome-associated ATPase